MSIRWNGKLQFSDFYIEDHHGDTLLFVKEFKTSILDFKKLNNSDFDLDAVEATQVYFNLKKYPNEETHSLKILLNKLRKDSLKKNKVLTRTSSIEIVQGQFVYNDLNKDTSQRIQINELTFLGSDVIYQGDQLDLKLDNLKGELVSPSNMPISVNGNVHYKPGLLALESFEISSEENHFKGSLVMNGKNKSLRNFIQEGSLQLNIEEGSLSLKDFTKNTPYLNRSSSFDFSFSAMGPLNALTVEKLNFKNDDINFSGNLVTKHLLDDEPLHFSMDIQKVKLETASLVNNIPSLSEKQTKYFKLLNQIELSGKISSDVEHLNLDLFSSNVWGGFLLKGILGKGFLTSKKKDRSLDLDLSINSIFLGQFSEQYADYTLDSELNLKGVFPVEGPMSINWKAENTSIVSNKITLDKIDFEGRFENKQLRNTFSINSTPVSLKSDILFDYGPPKPSYTVVANVTELNLNSLGLKLGADKKIFSGVVLSNFNGTSLDNLTGELKISSASISNDNKKVSLNPISIIKQGNGEETELLISNSDCISGNAKGFFKFTELRKLFQNALHQVYPFLPPKEPSKGQYLTFNLTIYEKLLDALYPSLSISENIYLKGKLASEGERSVVSLDAPILRWDSVQLQDIHFQLDTKNPLYNTFLSVSDLKHDYYSGSDFNMISTQLRDTLYFRSEFLGSKNATTQFDVNFYHTREKNGTSHFGFKKSNLPLGKDNWIINPSNAANEKISYSPKNKTVRISELNAVSGSQSIFVSGLHKNSNDFRFDINAKNVIMEDILPANPVLSIKGKASLNGTFERSNLNNKMDFKGEIENLNINDQELGELKLNSNGNTKTNIYYTNMNLIKQGQNILSLAGIWKDFENSTLNYDLKVNGLNLSFLSPLGKEAINGIEGVVKGDVNIWGPINDLKHNGQLVLDKAVFRVPYLNVEYNINETEVQLYDQVFAFKQVQMIDSDQETNATVNGTFSHNNFKDWNTNLRIESERMLLLNTVQDSKSLFFGQGYLAGEVRLEGPTKDLNISVEGKTDNGTTIKIPWAEDYGLSDTSFISFIDKNSQNRFTSSKAITQIEEISGLELNFELDVTNEAEIEIVIDQETGSYLRGKGAGNLFMEINTNGKFNMWGDYITFEGIYNFKNLGVIDKKFNVKPGGTIVWEGNPLEAQMDLEAVYDVPGGANPALLLDNPNFNKKIPTEVLIRLQGNLLKPDDPVFEIDFPNTSGTVASEINYRLSDPQRSQLQAISLLSQGIFINEVSVSMQGITNNLYQKASDIFSDLIGEENDKLKVGIDYLQGDKSALLDIATEDRLGFTLSTKISDRILLNGKIGVPVGGVEQTLIVGNVQIDFVLNEEGSLKAKVFNKENEFRYIGDELGYTQGVGLSYNVDFDTFKELIKKITAIHPDLESENVSENQELKNNDIIQFVNKKQ